MKINKKKKKLSIFLLLFIYFYLDDIVIGLVFKPRLGTIDIVVFRLNGEEAQEKKIYYDFFKVGPVPPSDQMKSSKAKVKRLAER